PRPLRARREGRARARHPGRLAPDAVGSRSRAGGVDHGGQPVLQPRRGPQQMSAMDRPPCCTGGDHRTLDRRELLTRAGRGIGSVALLSMLGKAELLAAGTGGLPTLPHFRPRARRAIWLFPAGAPSQIDTWDYKPKLREMFGKELPNSV